jgi:hypothetical protein
MVRRSKALVAAISGIGFLLIAWVTLMPTIRTLGWNPGLHRTALIFSIASAADGLIAGRYIDKSWYLLAVGGLLTAIIVAAHWVA